jgi:hypothetical protein
MKPTALRRGDRVRNRHSVRSIVWTFVRRVPAAGGRPAHCVLQSDECRGQNGPDDDGTAIASDYSIARHFERVSA